MDKSIRFKIIAPVTIIISLVLLLLIYQDYGNKVNMQLEQEKEMHELMAQRVLADMDNIFSGARLGLEAVAGNPEIQKAFAERDRERLLDLTMPVYERANREGIEQFQFHLAPAVSFLRLHAPDKYGDDLSGFRRTVLECNSTGTVVQGLEEGKGGFGFRVVLPVFYQGEQVGSVEYGPGLNIALLENWQTQMGGEYYIYGKPASGVAWEEQEGLLVATAEEDPFPISESEINEILLSKATKTIYVDNNRKVALVIPLEDYSGQPVGYIKIINDRSEIIAAMNRELRHVQVQAFIAVSVVLVVTLIITTVITRPLVRLSAVVGAVADGDLTQPVEKVKSKDEVGVLAEAMATMVHNLSDMISNVKGCSVRLADYSQELVSSSEEVSAAVEEVAGTANQVSAASTGGAQELSKVSRESEQVRAMAEKGNQAVQKTVEKINSIAAASRNVSQAVHMLSEQSSRIGEIIGTITNIADRTNLLALNAAIEAARAGEHGRGFAVVAEDVRRLAEQSAGAAKEITHLVKDIQSGIGDAVRAIEHGAAEVSGGVQVAEQAGNALSQITGAVENSMMMIKQVADSSQKASEDVKQLSDAFEQIATAVAQVTEAAQSLSNMAYEMHNGVVKFKVAGDIDKQ